MSTFALPDPAHYIGGLSGHGRDVTRGRIGEMDEKKPYIMLQASDDDWLDDQVCAKLAEGYQLYGNPFSSGHMAACQAMILPPPAPAPPISGEQFLRWVSDGGLGGYFETEDGLERYEKGGKPLNEAARIAYRKPVPPISGENDPFLTALSELAVKAASPGVRIKGATVEYAERDGQRSLVAVQSISGESPSPLEVAGGQRFEWTEEQARMHIDMLVSQRLMELGASGEPVDHPVLDAIYTRVFDHENGQFYCNSSEVREKSIYFTDGGRQYEVVVHKLARKD